MACDVGNETGSPVTTDCTRRKFNGDVSWWRWMSAAHARIDPSAICQ